MEVTGDQPAFTMVVSECVVVDNLVNCEIRVGGFKVVLSACSPCVIVFL